MDKKCIEFRSPIYRSEEWMHVKNLVFVSQTGQTGEKVTIYCKFLF